MRSSAVRRRIVPAGKRADGLADATAQKAQDSTSEDDSAAHWSSVVSALTGSESGPDGESDCSSNQNGTGASVIHPWSLVSFPGISAARWKWAFRSASRKLCKCFVVGIGGDACGLSVLTPRRRDCFLFWCTVCGLFGLSKCDRRHQKRRQQEVNVLCGFHERRVAVTVRLRWRSWDSFGSVTTSRGVVG
jgi:hypothetical protein